MTTSIKTAQRTLGTDRIDALKALGFNIWPEVTLGADRHGFVRASRGWLGGRNLVRHPVSNALLSADRVTADLVKTAREAWVACNDEALRLGLLAPEAK